MLFEDFRCWMIEEFLKVLGIVFEQHSFNLREEPELVECDIVGVAVLHGIILLLLSKDVKETVIPVFNDLGGVTGQT